MVQGHRLRNKRPTADAAAAMGPDPLWELKVKDIWRFLLTQPLSFWLVCTYLFLEYVRPQSVYPALDVLPLSQVTILLCLGALLLEMGMPRLKTVVSGLLAFFTLVVFLSSMAARRPDISWGAIDLYLSWVLIYVLIVNAVTTERRYLVFLFSFLLYSLKMSQHGARTWFGLGFGFQDWGATGGPGWFHNSGEFGIQMCVFIPLALHFIWALKPYLPKWKQYLLWLMPITGMMSIIGSSSRGAVVGIAGVGFWMVMRTRYRMRAAVGLVVTAAAVWMIVPAEQKERFSTMGEDGTSVTRLDMWEDGIRIANENPVFGIGYENWSDYYSGYAGTRLLPHNIFIEAVAELGYIGLLGFIFLILATFYLNAQTRRLVKGLGESGTFLHHSSLGLDGALVGYMGSGFFVTVLFYPYFWINLAMTVSVYLAAVNKVKAAAPAKAARPGTSRVHRLQKMPVG